MKFHYTVDKINRVFAGCYKEQVPMAREFCVRLVQSYIDWYRNKYDGCRLKTHFHLNHVADELSTLIDDLSCSVSSVVKNS